MAVSSRSVNPAEEPRVIGEPATIETQGDAGGPELADGAPDVEAMVASKQQVAKAPEASESQGVAATEVSERRDVKATEVSEWRGVAAAEVSERRDVAAAEASESQGVAAGEASERRGAAAPGVGEPRVAEPPRASESRDMEALGASERPDVEAAASEPGDVGVPGASGSRGVGAPKVSEPRETAARSGSLVERPMPRHGFVKVVRAALAWIGTLAAAAVILFTLVTPDKLTQFSLLAFVRIPIEGLLLVAVFLAVRGRLRTVVLAVAGVVFGVLLLVRLFNLGFYTALGRPFDPVLDWVLLQPAYGVLSSSVGRPAAIGVAVVLGLVVLAVPVVMALAVRRLGRLALRHPVAATRGTAALAIGWAVCAVLNVQFAALPVASDGATGALRDQVALVRRDVNDREKFGRQAAVDAFRDTPGSQLLNGLRGKDVLLAFVESYGRDAVLNPQFAPQVDATLDDGTRRLAAAGFAARSAFLTSSTFGGGSWLAHDTLLSGLWVDNQQRSDTLMASDRFTLNAAFRRAGWHVTGIMPAVDRDWPEGKFFQYNEFYDSRTIGYRGPKFSYVPVPDQFTLAAFQRLARGPGHAPVMAEIPLVSSHAPWTPIPQLVGWDAVGDGTVYNSMSTAGDPPDVAWRTSEKIHTAYRNAIVYSLSSLISYIETYGDDNLVVVFLGDHQPSPVIVGDTTNRDVPITIVARDPKVLDRVAGWGWQDGLRPDAQAPVWRMDSFRDKFLTAFA